MLDQNTDRMWFVIGAVIVGAAIIFIANGTLPTLFASVSDSFEESANKGTEVIDKIEMQSTLGQIDYGAAVNQHHGRIGTMSNEIYFASSRYIPVEANATYRFKTPEDTKNKRVVYYDENQTYLSGKLNDNGLEKIILQMDTVAPSNAKYARISTVYRENPWGAYYDVSEWSFEKIN